MKNLTLPKELLGVGSWHWLQKKRSHQPWENRVTNIKRISIRKGEEQIQTNIYILIFNQPCTPKEVKIGYCLERAEKYAPEVVEMSKIRTPQRSLWMMTDMCQMRWKGSGPLGGRLLEANSMCKLPTRQTGLRNILQCLQKRKENYWDETQEECVLPGNKGIC